MTLAAIGVGSNLNTPALQVSRAFEELSALPHSRLVARSPLYRSTPVGPDGRAVQQPDFCNAVVLLETHIAPRDLLDMLKALEITHGREPQSRGAARCLDLDLLVYGQRVLDESGLNVPHPRMAIRNFVLHPLRDVAPDLTVPGLGLVRELAMQLDSSGLKPWQD